ncbi:serine/threonine-protein kinase [Streptomyces sp. NPDC051907]|uniref:serine/threonine-protein kinase n=1 Tax=Streptomyces sp. NPDC051907 TaxID=3155284 RepID=UPI00343036B9
MSGGAGGADGRIVDGRFELRERLGSGGMGTVWRAWDTALHREVALKEVRPPDPAVAAARPDAARTLRERVLREARALARISHPHVVTIHHIVDEGAHPWIVMELLPGTTLQDRLAQGALSPRETARTGRQVLSALRAAHAAGIQHRDVKPANIMLRADGSAVLTDFGIAALQGSASLTATGDLIGSPEYIAPERIRGHDDDPASDFWSLGLVLYVCAEGVSPLRRATTLATLAAVLDDPVPPPVRSGPLAPVLSALLVRDPAARPDAARLDAMLEEVEAGRAEADAPPWSRQQTMTATRPGRPERPEWPDRADRAGWADRAHRPDQPDRPDPGDRLRSRTPVVAAVIGVALAITAGAALVLAIEGQEERAGGSAGGKGSGSPSVTATASPTAKPTTTPSPAPTPTPSPTQAPTPPPTPTPSPTLTPTATLTQSGAPVDGFWVAQLASVPTSAGAAARDRQEQALRDRGLAGVQYVESGAYASLRAGYWMFYVPGFDDGAAAVAWCRANGLDTKDECLGRFLSHQESDRGYLCSPAPGGGTTGRCTRP